MGLGFSKSSGLDWGCEVLSASNVVIMAAAASCKILLHPKP